MISNFEAEQELAQRQADALDKLRAETARHLRKYTRRIKVAGEARVKAEFTLNPGADPEKVADDALRIASQGMFLSTPTEVIQVAAPAPTPE